MNRRGFLGAVLAAAAAPYVVTKAGVLMPVKQIVTPERFWIAVDLAAEGGGNCAVVGQLQMWQQTIFIRQFPEPAATATDFLRIQAQVEREWSRPKKTLTQQI